MDIDVTIKKNFKKGMMVDILADEDKLSGRITRGYISTVISKADSKKGIKVELTSGIKGIAQHIPTKDSVKLENFKFYNRFFFTSKLYSIWNNAERKYFVMNYQNRTTEHIEQTVFLFDSKEEAQVFLNELNLDKKLFTVKEINRKKPIVENFKTLNVDYFRINKERKLSYGRMVEWEFYFKNMR